MDTKHSIKRQKPRLALFLIVMALLALAVSCRETVPLAPEEPKVVLTSPGNNSTLSAGDIVVRIYLQNFEMNSNFGLPNTPNRGHVIYYMDTTAPLAQGTAATAAPGSFAVSVETEYTWNNVAAGEHVFSVQLVNNDNTPLLPPVAVRVNVTVR